MNAGTGEDTRAASRARRFPCLIVLVLYEFYLLFSPKRVLNYSISILVEVIGSLGDLRRQIGRCLDLLFRLRFGLGY